MRSCLVIFFFFQAEDGIRDVAVTGVQTCALPILLSKNCSASVTGRSTTSPMLLPWSSTDRLSGRSRLPPHVGHGCSIMRSEERRGGEEGRSRWSPYHLKKKKKECSRGRVMS